MRATRSRSIPEPENISAASNLFLSPSNLLCSRFEVKGLSTYQIRFSTGIPLFTEESRRSDLPRGMLQPGSGFPCFIRLIFSLRCIYPFISLHFLSAYPRLCSDHIWISFRLLFRIFLSVYFWYFFYFIFSFHPSFNIACISFIKSHPGAVCSHIVLFHPYPFL